MAHYYPAGMAAFAEEKDSYAVISIQDTHTGGFGFVFSENRFCRGALTLYFESLEDTEIPVELPIRREDYLDVPAVFIRDDMIRSVLLLKKEAGEEVSIAFAYAFNHDGMALSCLINEAKKAVEKLYGGDVTVSTTSLGLHTERMMDKLFDGIEKKPVYYGIYYGE